MTSKLQIPPTLKDRKMADGIKGLVGKKMTKEVQFMGEKILISKLSVAEVMEIQEAARKIDENNAEGLEVLRTVIRSSVKDASDLSDEDFQTFPMDELSRLSNEIMKFSGIAGEAGK